MLSGMDYELVIRTDADGNPRIESHSGRLPADATITVRGGEAADADPWGELIVMNDIVIDTGAVTGRRRHFRTELAATQ